MYNFSLLMYLCDIIVYAGTKEQSNDLHVREKEESICSFKRTINNVLHEYRLTGHDDLL